MASVWESLHCVLLQVVNAGVKEAVNEFLSTWQEERLRDILHALASPNWEDAIETTGANLSLLIMNIMDLVSHFADFE